MSERQLELEIGIAKRRSILRRVPVGSAFEILLLRILDDHAGDGTDCWLKLSTLAAEMHTTARTVQKAIRDAVDHDYLIVIPKHETDKPCNTYRLRWAEMRDRCGLAADRSGGVGAPRAPTTRTTCAESAHHVRQVGAPHAPTNKNPEKNPSKNPIKPDTAAMPAASSNTRPTVTHGGGSGTAGVFKDGPRDGTAAGWGFDVTPEMLQKPSAVQRLFEIATRKTWGIPNTELARIRFFSAAVSVMRRSTSGGIRSPGGAFTAIVKGGQWHCANQADDERAREAIKKLDAQVVGKPPELLQLAQALGVE